MTEGGTDRILCVAPPDEGRGDLPSRFRVLASGAPAELLASGMNRRLDRIGRRLKFFEDLVGEILADPRSVELLPNQNGGCASSRYEIVREAARKSRIVDPTVADQFINHHRNDILCDTAACESYGDMACRAILPAEHLKREATSFVDPLGKVDVRGELWSPGQTFTDVERLDV